MVRGVEQVGSGGRLGKGQLKKEVKKTDSHYKKSRLSKGIGGGLLVRARVQKYSEKLILSAR